MPGFSQPLSFMGTMKIPDAPDILDLVVASNNGDTPLLNDKENNVTSGSHRRTRFTDQSNIRVLGGKAAGPKPIKANYDDDDARIVDLKQQGWSDEFVARKLAEEGRIRYVGRTVGSRWLRIRKALEAKEEEILEDNMSDWHDGEDERLEQAVQEIDNKIDKEIAKLRDKKWLQVAAHVADLIQKKKYTAKLCRERYDGLMDGTALKPIELDSDQEGRAEMRANRIATNKRLREEAAAMAAQEEELKKAARITKKEAQAANKAVKITRAQKKKVEMEKIAKMKEAALAQLKAQKAVIAQWAAYNKVESLWIVRKKKTEMRLLNKLLDLPASHRAPRSKNANVEDDEGEMTDRITDEEPEMDNNNAANNNAANTNNKSNATTTQVNGKHGRESGSGSDAPLKKRLRNSSSAKSMSPKHIAVGEAEVTDETRANPRAVMTLAELNSVLVRRDLLRASSQETQEQVVARLHMEDKMATVSTLNAMLKASGLETKGGKQAKIDRLQAYDVSRSAAGE
ncbi:hypothetical protein Q7P37_003443 [Cladosporium fusiforme]